MLKETAADVRARLAALVRHPPKGWGEFPLQKSIEFKRDMASVNRLLERSNAPAEKLRTAYNMISSYYSYDHVAAVERGHTAPM